MSMPHGETTGRTHPCTHCGAGAHLVCQDSVPRFAHQLVIVSGNPSINVNDEPGMFTAVGKHLVIGYPLLKRGDEVLMWVRSFAFPMTKARSDGLQWEERAHLQEALLQTNVDGIENIDVCWVSASELELNAVRPPADGYYLPDIVMVAGVWYYQYAMCLDKPHIAAPHVEELNFDNVRKQLKDHAHIHGVLPDTVTQWLKGWRPVPVPPPAPVLQPLSAEGVGIAGLAADIKLLADLGVACPTPMPPLDALMAGFGGVKKGELHMIAANPGKGKAAFPLDWQKLADMPMMRMPSMRGHMEGPPLAQNLPNFKMGDEVVWDVIGCGYHFCATVVKTSVNGGVFIRLRDGEAGWKHFQQYRFCPPRMIGWKATADGCLWVHAEDGVLRTNPFINEVMPPVASPPPPSQIIFASDTPPEAPDRVVVSIPTFDTEVPPMVDDTPLDAEEEGEVWSAFARYCATLNLATLTSQVEAERALDFFVKMRRKLCNMLE